MPHLCYRLMIILRLIGYYWRFTETDHYVCQQTLPDTV